MVVDDADDRRPGTDQPRGCQGRSRRTLGVGEDRGRPDLTQHPGERAHHREGSVSGASEVDDLHPRGFGDSRPDGAGDHYRAASLRLHLCRQARGDLGDGSSVQRVDEVDDLGHRRCSRSRRRSGGAAGGRVMVVHGLTAAARPPGPP